jgi:6-phosphogluconolactonase
MFRTLLALFVAATCAVPTAPAAEPEMLYVGTYSGKDSLGIYLFAMDAETGGLEPRGLAGEARHASFLCVAPRRRTVYAVSEVGTYEGQASGSVSAFAIDPATHRLTLLNRQASGGPGTCFVSTDANEAFVLAANFSGGSVRLFPVRDDGSLGAGASVQRHAPGVDAQGRTTKPFAHSIVVDPTGRFALAADMGTDRIYVYRIDREAQDLVPHDPPVVEVAAGSGPRHLAFHPTAAVLFAINEKQLSITSFSFDAARGRLESLETVPLVPRRQAPGNATAAEVAVDPSGRFVLGSIRGHNSISVLAFDEAARKLTAVGHVTDTIDKPRNFVIHPSGRFVLVGNQRSGTITVFRLDPQSGALTRVGDPTPCPSPVCLRFAPGRR